MMHKIRPYFFPFLLIIGIISIGKLLQNLLLLPLAEAAYNGESFSYLNELLAHHQLKDPEVRNLDFYKSEIPKYTNRLIFLGSIVVSLLWLIFKDSQKRFKSFLYEEKSALSLSVLRITVLGLILYINFPATLSNMISLGSESIVAPFGWTGTIIESLSNPVFIKIISFSFLFFSIGSLIGFYTNFMLLGAAITGFFVIGIPQFYGKMDSFHILWHVLLFLSFTKCGDSLSVDAWRKKLPQLNISRSLAFGVPVKLIMLLLGVSYFFPGFWKFIISGFEWAFSDNLQLKLYSKWLQLDGWTPVFRIDHYPFLYQFAAFATLIIEIGFIFALFFKKVRPLFVIGAFCFHLSVLYFMNIPFYGFMVLYVIFIDWDKILKKILPHLTSLKKLSFSNNQLQKMLWVGGFLIFGNIATGSLLIKSWPFSVYPTFASMESETVPSLLIQALDNEDRLQKETIPILDDSFKTEFASSVKLRGFLRDVLNAEKPDSSQISLLTEIFIESNEFEKDFVNLRFYEIRLSTNPDEFPKDYRTTNLLFEVDSVFVKN